MAILVDIREAFESGDPVVRSWSMVQNSWSPLLVISFYVLFIKRLAPILMKGRRPFDLRLLMILYNFIIVFLYIACLIVLGYQFCTTDSYKFLCNPVVVKENHYSYTIARTGWYLYILKYVELLDTVFFVLRKKFELITNLHLIHHTSIPLAAWVLLRTETSGFQFIPVVLNAIVHIIMYTYYGLAAMGPEVQRKLWWKEHLTQFQMVQFVLIFMLFLLLPVSGCQTHRYGYYMDGFFGLLFLALFYNYYRNTYKNRRPKTLEMANGKQKAS